MPNTSPSSDSADDVLAKRVVALERAVVALDERFERLERRLDAREQDEPASPSAAVASSPGRSLASSGETVASEQSGATLPRPPRPETAPPRERPGRDRQASPGTPSWSREQWLSRIGITLLLLGVGFFFKFSADQGWLQPPVRVACGFVLGLGLGTVGLYVRRRPRPLLGQVLMGGAGAVLSGTVFAAHQLYGLIGSRSALVGATGVAGLTAWRALVQKDAALAVVAALGALGAPFLLRNADGGVLGMVTYTSLVLTSGAAVYFAEGWRSVLYTVVWGGWLTFASVLSVLPENASSIPGVSAGRIALQGGVVFAWLLFWGVTAGREVMERRTPGRWTTSYDAGGHDTLTGRLFLRSPAYALAFSSPLLVLAFSHALWIWTPAGWGGVAFGAALVYASAYWGLRESKTDLSRLAKTHALVAIVLVAYALSELTGGETFLLTLTAEACAVLVLSRMLTDRVMRCAAHGLFGAAALVLAGLLLFEGAPGLFSVAALSRLAVLALAVGTVHGRGGHWVNAPAQRIYRVVVLVLFLGWCAREGAALGLGEALLLALAVEAAGLLVLARLGADRLTRFAGHGLSGVAALVLAGLLLSEGAAGLFSVATLARLAVLGLAVGLTRWPRPRWMGALARRTYQAGALVLFLGACWREGVALGGEGLVTSIWAAVAVALLTWGVRRGASFWRDAALGVVVAVLVKLFLVDLVRLAAVWRVLLFCGLGGLFLAFSYFLPDELTLSDDAKEQEG